MEWVGDAVNEGDILAEIKRTSHRVRILLPGTLLYICLEEGQSAVDSMAAIGKKEQIPKRLKRLLPAVPIQQAKQRKPRLKSLHL